MNILVTGGAGFIGSHMAKRHLADGHRVVIVDDLSSGRRERLPEKARFVLADIASVDLEPLLREEKIDFVSHHAAQIDLRHSVADPIGDARANVIGGLMLFEAMRRAGVAPRSLLLDRRRDLRRAGGRAAGARVSSDESRLSLRLREALDREVHALLPRGARLPDAGLPLRQRLRPVAGRHRRGRRRRDLLGGDARPPAAQDQRRRRADARLRLRRRPRRGRRRRGEEREERRLESRHGGRDLGQRALFAAREGVRLHGDAAPRRRAGRRAEAERPRRLARAPRLRPAALDAARGRPEGDRRVLPEPPQARYDACAPAPASAPTRSRPRSAREAWERSTGRGTRGSAGTSRSRFCPASFSSDADRLRRFEQEARAAGLLNHPNITGVYDIGQHDGAPYVVQELLEGETLRTELAGGRFSPRKAIEHAIQIAQGLAAAHEKGIVHRDLKPENLFITKDGRIKILDFGLAKLTEVGTSGSATNFRPSPRARSPVS